jgi:HAE1 family hydrophobic/amphiphilic exporter-1
MSRFFLDHPVFAWVIAIVMMLGGALAIYKLPIAQYPPVAPPSISIRAVYPGASAQTIENSVIQIIEQKMTGLDRMIYMGSTSDASGSAALTLTFAPGTDPDLAWAKVQNKLRLAIPMLPEVVQRTGLSVGKATRNYLLIVGLTSSDPTWTNNDLSDYLVSNVQNALVRVPGVGEVEPFGSGYAMRVWLDTDKLTKYGMTIADVVAGVRAYNVEISAGQFGGAPAVPGQRLNASILVQSLLKTPEEFAAVPLRTNPDGSVVRVSDVGRTELGSELNDISANYNGRPTTALAIRQAVGANALDVADGVKAAMKDLSKYFPKGMEVVYPYDTTPFVKVAIGEVVKTLIEAIILVFLVMFLFLGNLRATLIPTIAVPVVLLGTFAVLGLFGFSINMLTMFAMVLSIGLLVDDAIVVVENVERLMSEEGLSPREATAKSMDQIQSALVGIGLVLAAVFGPMAFFPGSTGVIYRQFSITVVASMLLSVVVALILSPVLCAGLLKPVEKGHEAAETGFRVLKPFFLWFDRLFYRMRDVYERVVGHILGRRLRYVAVFVVIVAGLAALFSRMPTAYLPEEDQGILLASVQTPAGSTLEQTGLVVKGVQKHFLEQEKDAIEASMGMTGMGFGGRSQNQGMIFLKLRDWKLRNRPELRVKSIAARAMPVLAGIREARGFVFPPRRSRSWRRPPALTSCCRTGAGWATNSSWPRAISYSAPRCVTRGWFGCDPMDWRTWPSTRWTSTGRKPAPSACCRASCRATSPGRLAAPTSATSSRVAASSASTRRPTRRFGCCRPTSTGCICPAPAAVSFRFRRSPPGAGSTDRRGSSVTTPRRRSTFRARPRRATAPGRRCRPWRSTLRSSRRGSATSGPASPTRSAWPSRRPACSTRFRCSPSS